MVGAPDDPDLGRPLPGERLPFRHQRPQARQRTEFVPVSGDDEPESRHPGEEAQVHKGDGGRDKNSPVGAQSLDERPPRHRRPEGVARHVVRPGSTRLQERQSRGHVFHFIHTPAINPGASPHPAEIEAQGRHPPGRQGAYGGQDHVVGHSAPEQGVGVGDDRPAGRRARR